MKNRGSRGFRFSEGCRRPGNGASHLASCPNYHFVAKLRASSATIVWEWRTGMSDEVKIDSDTGAASLLRLLMPAVHFHLRISSEHSLSRHPAPFLSVPPFPRYAGNGLRTEVRSETQRQSEEQASGVILQENVT